MGKGYLSHWRQSKAQANKIMGMESVRRSTSYSTLDFTRAERERERQTERKRETEREREREVYKKGNIRRVV